jgi:Na+-driven multidrug efflux pump
MGNTIPPLITSAGRLLVVAVPTVLLTQLPGFELRWIWYLSAASIAFQLALNLLLLQREFRIRLRFEAAPAS